VAGQSEHKITCCWQCHSLHPYICITVMDLLGYYKSNICVYVWDLNSEEHPMIASWTDIDVDKICLSATVMRIGILSFKQSTISVFEVPSQTLICEAHFPDKLGGGLGNDFVCSSAFDKAALVTSLGIFVQDLASSSILYRFSMGATSLLFSHDGRFVYVMYTGRVAQCDSITGVEMRAYKEAVVPPRCCNNLIQNCSGSRIMWTTSANLAVTMSNASDCNVVVLDNSSGDIVNTIPSDVGRMYSFRDDEVIVIGRSGGIFASGHASILNISTSEQSRIEVIGGMIIGATVCNDIPTLFEMAMDSLYATDLSNGQRLFSISIPLFLPREHRICLGFGAEISKVSAGSVVLM
jgi:hypothetical protein